MASVTYRNVVKYFDKTRVIEDFSLTINDGELVVFVGPSGCGKTTLLRLLAGLEQSSKGEIYIDGNSVNGVPPRDRNIAMVFQNYALYPHMTVANNMGFGLKMAGVSRQERRETVGKVAELLALSELLARKPGELSGGQRQRVAMGRAIARRPSVYLMDEPLSNLDAELRNHVRAEIKQLQRQLNTTMIYVTHDQTEAMTLARRIAVMNDGVLQQFGSPDELYSKPTNTFVASFLGVPPMNFFPAQIIEAEMLTLPLGAKTRLSKKRLSRLGDRKELEIGIRPENIGAGPAEDGAEMFEWSAPVVLCEPLGGETLVHVDIGGRNVLIKVKRGHNIREGQVVALHADPSLAHIFEPEGVCLSHGRDSAPQL